MKIIKLYIYILSFFAVTLCSCIKPNFDDSFTPGDPLDPTGGYSSSDEVFRKFLVAYWNFDDNNNEIITNTAPTQTANTSFIDGGIKGKALSLSGGYLYYAKQFNAFKKDSLKSFSISEWIQISNNGSKRTMIFQIARPGIFDGNLNFRLNTQSFPTSNITDLKINPYFVTVNGTSTQDNINTLRDAPGAPNYFPYITPPIGSNVWVHLVLTYDASTGFFDIWANGVRAGAFFSRGTGNSLFTSHEPNEVIIGANYNTIPGKSVNTNTDFVAMTGVIDEIRVFSRPLSGANVKALYSLGLAKK